MATVLETELARLVRIAALTIHEAESIVQGKPTERLTRQVDERVKFLELCNVDYQDHVQRIWNVKRGGGAELIITCPKVEMAFTIARQTFKEGDLTAWELDWIAGVLSTKGTRVYKRTQSYVMCSCGQRYMDDPIPDKCPDCGIGFAVSTER
jgi:hypothetical protein